MCAMGRLPLVSAREIHRTALTVSSGLPAHLAKKHKEIAHHVVLRFHCATPAFDEATFTCGLPDKISRDSDATLISHLPLSRA